MLIEVSLEETHDWGALETRGRRKSSRYALSLSKPRLHVAPLSDCQMLGTLSPMVIPASARLILASLISIGMQLCCCNIQVLLGGSYEFVSGTCESHVDCHGSDKICSFDCHTLNVSAHAQSCCDQSAPSGPCHHDDDGCACGTHDKAPSHIDQIVSPLTFLAILPDSMVVAPTFVVIQSRYAGLHGVSPPRTSLLQQHCALIV